MKLLPGFLFCLLVLWCATGVVWAQNQGQDVPTKAEPEMAKPTAPPAASPLNTTNTVKIEIWSDVQCPFCYIGKRHLEAALAQFPHADQVEIVWRSFELDPNASATSTRDLYDVLSTKYGQPRQWAINTSNGVAQQGKTVGLEFNFAKAIPTNTFNAHRLIHLAGQHGKAAQAEEALFAAHFTHGQNVGDPAVLQQIGASLGLPPQSVADLLASDQYGTAVRADEAEAQQLGISGVPFFLLNRQYAVSGAQPVSLFIDALNKAWAGAQPPIPTQK